MKRFVFLSLTLTIFSFSACHKNSTVPNIQATIAGKWNLQKQTYVQYVNAIKQVDTVCLASDTAAAYVQFNTDKSFKSEGVLISKNPLNSSNAEVMVSGTYTATNSMLTVSNTMAGIVFFAPENTTGTNLPAISNMVHTSKLNSITSTTLSIHTEDSYTATANSVSTNYKTVNDFYYTK